MFTKGIQYFATAVQNCVILNIHNLDDSTLIQK